MLATILGILCGAVLGFRFKVLILVPTIALGWALAGTVGALAGNSWASMAMTMALVALSLQAGYFAGIGLRRLMVAVRRSRRRTQAHSQALASDHAG